MPNYKRLFMQLSKTDFQLGSSCPKKLIYKKRGYPTSNDTNEYMEVLAQGGYIIGKMATLLFNEGIEIEGSQENAISETERYMQLENCVLFEATIKSNDKIVRVDILMKTDNHIHIIEVKAKSHDSEDDMSNQEKKLEKYIEDVVYQYYVVSEKYPDFDYSCSLLMPDKSKRTEIDSLAGWFNIEFEKAQPSEIEELPARQFSVFKRPIVKFKYEGHPQREKYINQLKSDGILEYRDITKLVKAKVNDINQRADNFLRILKNGITNEDFVINKNCKSCEFKISNDPKCGYMECWGDLALPDPHIFDLYFGGTLGKNTYLDELIKYCKTSLYDINLDVLFNAKGQTGARGERQLIQITNTKTATEWISPEFQNVLNSYIYPLHFIDFETYTGAIPFHRGMRPYELIAFQWSCHTITHKGAEPVHSEWIHTDDDFPNFQFATALMNQIGNMGTPFMWATHENTVLRTILNQMEIFEYQNNSLKEWLINITKDSKMGRDGRLFDMNALTLKYYFHPDMKGRTSIKKVLPAIWNNNTLLHEVYFFKKYVAKDSEGHIVSPYKTLLGDFGSDDNEEAVNDGTAAMKAYNDIRFNECLSTPEKQELKRQLLQYCELDTMAMVMIANYWGLK